MEHAPKSRLFQGDVDIHVAHGWTISKFEAKVALTFGKKRDGSKFEVSLKVEMDNLSGVIKSGTE